MSYCSVTDVLNATGLTRDRIIELSERHTTSAQVNTLISGMISDAEEEIREALHINYINRLERHLGTGEDDVFELGPLDEDSLIYYDVANNLIDVLNVYFGGTCPAHRKLRPYPLDCELGTESDTDWTGTATLSTSTTRRAGSVSIQAVFANATQFARHPDITSNSYIDKNIDPLEYMAFYVRSNTANVVLTIRLYENGGTYNEATYTIVNANHWYLVMLDLDDNFTNVVDWDDLPLMYIDFRVDQACTLLIDNLNINDEWMFTAPAGEVAIMRRLDDEPVGLNYPFYVTYRYDPYLSSTPRNIKRACAFLAGVDLIDFMRGIRQSDIDFLAEADSGVAVPDREALNYTRNQLLEKYDKALMEHGYGHEFDVIRCDD